MPWCCSVNNCKFTSESAPEKSFHQYPKDIKVRDAWMKRIRREHFEPSEHSYVCSYHFTDEDFRQPNKDSPAKFPPTPGSIPSCNLHGQGTDERILQRNSRTSTKARSTPPVEGRASNVGQIHPHVHVNVSAEKPTNENISFQECCLFSDDVKDIGDLKSKVMELQEKLFRFN